MNTTSKASNAFEAFFGIHETLPREVKAIKLLRLHEEPPMYNIGMYLRKPYQINIMTELPLMEIM